MMKVENFEIDARVDADGHLTLWVKSIDGARVLDVNEDVAVSDAEFSVRLTTDAIEARYNQSSIAGGETTSSQEVAAENLDELAKALDWSDEELRHAKENAGNTYGDECIIRLENGRSLHTPAYPNECDYVRIVDAGHELAYWVSDEWAVDPCVVMGAIIGCAHGIQL